MIGVLFLFLLAFGGCDNEQQIIKEKEIARDEELAMEQGVFDRKKKQEGLQASDSVGGQEMTQPEDAGTQRKEATESITGAAGNREAAESITGAAGTM